MKRDIVGFGTHIIIDGRGANADHLGDRERIRNLAEELVEHLEPGHKLDVQIFEDEVDGEPGLSAGAVLAESHLLTHTFPHRRIVNLSAFSRREISPWTLVEALERAFEVGRVESYLTNRARAFPRDPTKLRSLMLGERRFVSVRLDDSLLAAETDAASALQTQ